MATSQPQAFKRVLVTGDCMLGRLVDEAMTAARLQEFSHRMSWLSGAVQRCGQGGGSSAEGSRCGFVWGDVLPLLQSADLRLINLETSVTTHPHKWPGQAFNFRMSPANMSALTTARVDFCSLANNHILDFLEEGMLETMRSLAASGIFFSGCGANLTEASEPAHLRLDGIPVACFSAADHYRYWAATPSTPGIHFIDPEGYKQADLARIAAKVREARQAHSGERVLAVMCFHWGPNYSWKPSTAIQRLAHDLIDNAGMDLIIGTSAHHVQGIEIYKGRPILYGCGDFLDDYIVDDEYRNDLGFAYALSWDADAERWAHIDLHPTRISRMQVTLLQESNARRWLLHKMASLCGDFGTMCEATREGLRISVPQAAV